MIPGLKDVFEANPVSQFKTLGDVLSGLLNIVFYASLFLTFFYLVWGAFAYLMAQGKKEELGKARSKIAWALIGLGVILLAFFIAKFISEVFKDVLKGGVPF